MTKPTDTVVYTCVAKDYDRLRPIVSSEERLSFVCFTDQPGNVPGGWKSRRFRSPPRLQDGHDINRYHKLFPHHLFPDHRYSIYMDGNVEYLDSHQGLVESFKKANCGLGAFRHPDMRNLTAEFDACRRLGKFDAYDARRSPEQLRAYRASGFDVSQVITANYLLLRDHQHPNVPAAMSLWWAQLVEYAKRDQLSLNFVLWKENVPFVFLDDLEGVDSASLLRRSHRVGLLKRLHRKAMAMTSSYWPPFGGDS